MPRPRPPCRVDTIPLPVFGMSWYANPGEGTSIVAYCGGGGSAKTGVNNFIFVREPGKGKDFKISTGDNVGVGLVIYENPLSKLLWLTIIIGKQVQRYTLFPEEREEEQPNNVDEGNDESSTEYEDESEDEEDEDEDESNNEGAGKIAGIINVGDGTNALAVNAMADRLAVGCESGIIKVYKISDEFFGYSWNSGKPSGDIDGNTISEALYTLEGHTKAVSALAFSMRNSRLLSSGKDGFAILWQEQNNTHVHQQKQNENNMNISKVTALQIAKLKCEIPDPVPKPKRPQQILVRGCAFGDLEAQMLPWRGRHLR